MAHAFSALGKCVTLPSGLPKSVFKIRGGCRPSRVALLVPEVMLPLLALRGLRVGSFRQRRMPSNLQWLFLMVSWTGVHGWYADHT